MICEARGEDLGKVKFELIQVRAFQPLTVQLQAAYIAAARVAFICFSHSGNLPPPRLAIASTS